MQIFSCISVYFTNIFPSSLYPDINTLDWGSANLLAVALGSVVYVWNADTSSIKELYRTGFTSQYNTAVKWDQSGRLLAVAKSDGEIQVRVVQYPLQW